MARKLPSFPFYPGDWRKDADLSRCSHAAKGVWIDMLCVAFDCERRGVFATANVPWTIEEIAVAVGGNLPQTVSSIRELVSKGVVKLSKDGALFSARLVRDEENRQKDAKRKSDSRLSGSCPISVTRLSEDESERKENALSEEQKPPGWVGGVGEGVGKGEFDLTAAGLAQRFCFMSVSTGFGEKDPYRAEPVFADLLKGGIPADRVFAWIVDAKRPKRQTLREFCSAWDHWGAAPKRDMKAEVERRLAENERKHA